MGDVRRFGRLNVKALIVLVVIVGLIAGGAVALHFVRHRTLARTALNAGTAAMQRKDWPEACKQFRVYLSKYPDDEEIRGRYAEANLAVRPQKPEHVEAAMGAYRRLLQRRTGDADLCLKLAKLYYRIGDFAECAYVSRQRLAKDADDAAAMLWLGRALVGQGKEEEAADVLRSLVGKRAGEVKAYALLAGIAMQGDAGSAAASARAWLDQAVEANAQSAEARAQRGRFYRLIDKNEAAARGDLEAADVLRPNDPAVLIVLATEWMEWRELDKAAHELELMEQTDAATLKEYDVEQDLLTLGKFATAGRLALLRGDAEGGAKLADQALQQLPEQDQVPFLPVAVDLYVAVGRVPDARAAVEKLRDAVKLSGDAGSPLAGQLSMLDASVAEAEGRHYAVINLLEPLVEDKPQTAQVWKLLAQAYEKTSQDRRALTAYEEYVRRAPHDREVILQLAEAYLSHDATTAAKYAIRAERMAPEDVRAKLARIAAQLDLAESEAVDSAQRRELGQELVRLREAHPENVRIRVLRAKHTARAGKLEDAVGELEPAMEQCSDVLPAALEQAQYYGRLGRTEKAIEVCSKAVALRRDAPAPRILLADLCAAADRIQEARETLERAVAELSGQGKLAAQVALAQLLLPRGHRDEAISLLRQVAAEHPDNVQVLAGLLRLPEVQKNAQESQQLVDKIKDVEGDRGLLWRFEQARVWLREYQWRQRQREIEQHLTRCIAADPGWSEPVLVLARMYETQRRDDEAERIYRLALSSAPQQIEVVTQLLALLERRGRFADAAAILERMPQDMPALNSHRVEAAIGLGDFASAIGYLERQIAARPNDAASRVALARLVYAHGKDVARAVKLLDEAAAASPDSLAAVSTKASILRAEGKSDEAAALLDGMVARRNDFSAYLARAEFHAAAGRFDLAEKDYTHLTTFAGNAVDGYAALARFYQKSGKTSEAVAACDAGLAIEPDNADLQRLLLKGLVAGGQRQALDRAVAMLDELLARLPDDVELLAVRAGALLARNTPDSTREAKTVLERVVELDPQYVNAHLQLIELAGRRGDLKEADNLAIRALGANPGSAELILARAGVEADLDNARVARELAASVLQTDPRSVKARNLLSKLALQAGDVATARAFNEEARNLAPTDESAQVTSAEILERSGQPAEAAKVLESYCESERGRGSVRALLALAELYRGRNEFEKAGARIDQAAGVSPDGGAVFLARLRWLAAQGRFDEVRKQLTDRRDRHPGESSVLLPATMILASSGVAEQLKEVKSLLDGLLLLEPTHVPAHLALAQVAYRLGDTDVAVQAYRRVLELEPDHGQALNDLAWVLAHHRGGEGLQEAATLADRGLRFYPEDIHLLDTRGVVLFALGRLEDARKDLEKCVALAEPYPATRAKALLHLAQVLGKTGAEAGEIRARLEEVQRIDQTHHVLTDEERAEVAALLKSP